jgi:hypothetical protein
VNEGRQSPGKTIVKQSLAIHPTPNSTPPLPLRPFCLHSHAAPDADASGSGAAEGRNDDDHGRRTIRSHRSHRPTAAGGSGGGGDAASARRAAAEENGGLSPVWFDGDGDEGAAAGRDML